MENYLITAIILCCYLRSVLTEADLHHQNAAQDQLNPLHDYENEDTSAKEQDKRTIFNSANYGWAKHVGIKPFGHKYVLGYSPVDLKYTPLNRPLSVKHPGYVYDKPKINFHLRRPAVQFRPVKPVVWKPAVSVKPVVSVHVPPPPPHHHHLITKPVGVAHVDHVHVKPVHHVDHVGHVDHVHQVPHTDVIHQVQVPHAGHVHNVPVHVDHVHPAPVQPVHIGHVHSIPVQPVALAHPVPGPLPQPLVPVAPHPQFIPSPLFEVTKPDLGVLPLGAAFPSPILKSFPHIHQVPLSLKPALVPQPFVPAALPLPHPVPVPRPAVFPQPVVPQSVYPPGTVVEYHGATNFINQIPLPQIPVNAVHPGLPPHLHFQFSQIPQHVHHQPLPLPHEQHDVQTPVIPAGHPHFAQQPIHPGLPPHLHFQFSQIPQHAHPQPLPLPHEQHDVQTPAGRPHFAQQPTDLPQFQQQLPLETSSHFQPTDQVENNNLFQQQLPINTQQTQFQSDQNNQFVQQTQDSGARYQPADQVSTQQFFHGSINPQQGNFEQLDQQEGGYVYQQPEVPFRQQSIQPGETDLQLPVQLPQHPGFIQNSRQFQHNNVQEPSQLQSVFRPSVQLEPPYKK